MDALRCCCGSQDCAFLSHNSTLLEGVERDVAKAAQLGQALLIRHEAYVADSERDRRQMTARIEALEQEKLQLEQRNAETIKANRDLLDQLEQLNTQVATSDAQIQALTDTLQSTEEEIQRLSSLAARTQNLERQLIDLEREQVALQGTLETKIGDERTAVQRWRRAEKTIGDLQDQIDRIEAEARAERERHVEIVARMERRMAVEGELATAAGRLKAKAGQEAGTTNVVSHFVKDILLDNANLQHGILELREMLQNSNEEVERLREHLQAHQPAPPTLEHATTPTANLKKELGSEPGFNQVTSEPVLNQELHIHHHYHGPAPKKEAAKNQTPRRPRKKRQVITPGRFAPLVQPDTTSTATILSQTAVTVPPNIHRWSNATTLAPSSVPGSPFSMSHRGSVHDRVFSDVAYDSSRPTSPANSDDLSSPISEPADHQRERAIQDNALRRQKRTSQSLKPPSLSTIRSTSSPISLTAKSSPATAIVSAASPPDSLANDIFLLSPSIHSVIPEESEESSQQDTQSLNRAASDADFNFEETLSPTTPHRPALHRAVSHESMISVSGMDIHTLQSRPSQLLFSTSPRLASPSSGTSSQPVLSPWTATATASMSRQGQDSTSFNRTLLYGSLVNQKRGVGTLQKKTSSPGLGKKVGGWVFGKWGASPTSSTTRAEPPSSTADSREVPAPAKSAGKGKGKSKVDVNSPTPLSAKRAEVKSTDIPFKLRPPGVNQSGPIWGFFDDIPPTPAKVEVTDLDADALGEALAET